MKAVLLILLVCVAGTYAQSGPLSGLIDNISSTLQQAINDLLASVLNLLPIKPRLDLSTLIASLTQAADISALVDAIAGMMFLTTPIVS